MREIRLTVWSRDYVRRGPVRAPLSVTMEAHWNAASSLSFTIDPQDARADDLREPGARVVAEYVVDDVVILRRSGVVESVGGSRDAIEVKVRDDWADVMQQLTGWPNPDGDMGEQGDDGAYWTRKGPAETVALDAIRENATRAGLTLVVPTSQGRGGTVDVSLRFHPLADRLYPQIDDAGIGVAVVQVGAERRVEIAERVTRTRVLTQASGAVLDGSWSQSAPTVTRVVVACGGEGILRVLRSYVDTQRETVWPVREAFVDARDIPADDLELDAKALKRGDEKLAEGAAKSSVNAPLAESPRFAFGRSYSLGDVVPIQLEDSPVISDVVRQVAISWTTEDGLVVTPKVGLWDDSPDTNLARTVAQVAREQRDRRTI